MSSSSAVVAKPPHYTGDAKEIKPDGSTFKIKPRELNIVWGNDQRYWRWYLPKEGGNGAVEEVELIQVCWLEVTAEIPLSKLQVGEKYKVSFEVSLKAGAFGWNGVPIHLMAKVGKKGKYKRNSFNLDTVLRKPGEFRTISLDEPIQICSDDVKGSLYFGVYEVWRGRWKGGLLIKGAKVEPWAKVEPVSV